MSVNSILEYTLNLENSQENGQRTVECVVKYLKTGPDLLLGVGTSLHFQ